MDQKRARKPHAEERGTGLLDESWIEAWILRSDKLIEASGKPALPKPVWSPLLGLLVKRRDIFIIADIPHRYAGTVASPPHCRCYRKIFDLR